jgi:hypothetical protein
MQRYRYSLIAVAALATVLVVGLFASTGGTSTSAQDGGAVLQMPDFPPTPTIPPAPAGGPALQGAIVAKDSFDGANGLGAWQVVDRGMVLPGEESVWTVENGRLTQARTAKANNPDFRETMAVAGDASLSDYTVTAKVFDMANATFGVVARRQGDSFYRLRWYAAGTQGGTPLVLEKVVNGASTTLATVDSQGYEHRRWYTIGLRVNGSSIEALVDGQTVLSASDSSLASGQYGVSTIAFGAVSFDDITVSAP